MLEKLLFSKKRYKHNGMEHIGADVFSIPDCINDSSDFRMTFQNFLSQKLQTDVIIEKTERGRLGITYKVLILESDQKFFAKTHRRGVQYKNNIEKEYYCLKKANSDFFVNLDYFTYNNEYVYAYMLQEWLENMPSLALEKALDLIGRYSSIIDVRDEVIGKTTYTIYDFVDIAKAELAFLIDSDEISALFGNELFHNIERFEPNIPNLKKVICHGDFGDKNVMVSAKGNPVVIDWEDCFVGVEGYDYLYWLTFFNHRKFYSTETFKASGLSSADAKGILSVVMIIKTALSVYSGLNKNNSVSSQERIEEILRFCNY